VTTWPLVLASAALKLHCALLESTHTASWLLVVVVAAVPPTVLGLRVHLAVGMRRGGMDPGRPRPLLEGMPAGAADTQVDGAGGVNGVSEVPTPGMDRSDQRVGSVGSTPSEWAGGETSDTQPEEDRTDRGRASRLPLRGEEQAELVSTRGFEASTCDVTQRDNPLDAPIAAEFRGSGDPDRQPPACAVPVGVSSTEPQILGRVNEVDEAVTRDSMPSRPYVPGRTGRVDCLPVSKRRRARRYLVTGAEQAPTRPGELRRKPGRADFPQEATRRCPGR
jgi:hypothetical protein